MSKPVIACDIDEVLAPLHDLVFAHHNAVYGTNYQARDPSGKYYIDQFSGDSYEDIKIKLRRFIETPEFISVKPLEGAVQAIEVLVKRFHLEVITSRQDFWEDITHSWLQEHFAGSFKNVHFTEYVTGMGMKIPKSQFCKQMGASYLIDDNLENVLDVSSASIEVVLFGDYPWNQHDSLPDNVTRCTDWTAVLEYFDGRG